MLFTNGDVTIAGTLFLPSSGSKHPAIVYIAGSGDTTRGDGSFLADRLALAGVGESTGDWHQGGFEELAGDAIAALRFVQSRPDIELRRTGFVCQSQGCWVAPIAMRLRAPAHFLVSQSGPGVSVAAEDLDYYRVTLTSQGFGENEIAEAFELASTDQKVTLGKVTWSELQRTLDRFHERAWFKSLGYEPQPAGVPIRTFDRHTLEYDPAADIDALRIPSLWSYGGHDHPRARLDRRRGQSPLAAKARARCAAQGRPQLHRQRHSDSAARRAIRTSSFAGSRASAVESLTFPQT